MSSETLSKESKPLGARMIAFVMLQSKNSWVSRSSAVWEWEFDCFSRDFEQSSCSGRPTARPVIDYIHAFSGFVCFDKGCIVIANGIGCGLSIALGCRSLVVLETLPCARHACRIAFAFCQPQGVFASMLDFDECTKMVPLGTCHEIAAHFSALHYRCRTFSQSEKGLKSALFFC